jgi:hypothetical protein
MKKLAAGLMLVTATIAAGPAGPASADPVPESDQVTIQLSGANRAAGSVYWSSYRSGSGTVRVYNDQYDHQCVRLEHRVMVGGSWRGWVGGLSTTVCTATSYPFTVSTPAVSSNIQYWQFRLIETVSNRTGYDTNQPGGA